MSTTVTFIDIKEDLMHKIVTLSAIDAGVDLRLLCGTNDVPKQKT